MTEESKTNLVFTRGRLSSHFRLHLPLLIFEHLFTPLSLQTCSLLQVVECFLVFGVKLVRNHGFGLYFNFVVVFVSTFPLLFFFELLGQRELRLKGIESKTRVNHLII